MKLKHVIAALNILMIMYCCCTFGCRTVESYGPEEYYWYVSNLDEIESFELKSGRLLKVDSGQVSVLKTKSNVVYAFVIRTADSLKKSENDTVSVVTKFDTLSISEVTLINVNAEETNKKVALAVGITAGVLLVLAAVGLIILANYGPFSDPISF